MRVLIRPQLVARREGTIEGRRDPVLHARRLQRDRALEITRARHAPWRIPLLSPGGAEREQGQERKDCEPARYTQQACLHTICSTLRRRTLRTPGGLPPRTVRHPKGPELPQAAGRRRSHSLI